MISGDNVVFLFLELFKFKFNKLKSYLGFLFFHFVPQMAIILWFQK